MTKVESTLHKNKANRSIVIPKVHILNIVVMKFNEPAIEDIPARCILKIAVSTELPACAKKLLNGGYKVHPVPTPKSVKCWW